MPTILHLEEAFDTADIQRYNQFVAGIPPLPPFPGPSGNDQFLFAAIHTTQNLIDMGRPGNDSKYIEKISDKLTTGGGEPPTENGDFQISNYIGEILQNSFDHHSETSPSIDIDIQFDGAGGFTYRHNGVPFGYESNFKDSTLSGLIVPGSKLKRLDFRVGTFGIGFKIWVYFFKQFRFKSVKGKEKFTFTINATKDGEYENFQAEVEYDSNCNEDDTIEFQFSENKFQNDTENTLELVQKHAAHMMSFFTRKEVNITIIGVENQQHCLSSQITDLSENQELPTQEVKIVNQESEILVHQLNVTPNMQELMNEPLDFIDIGVESKTWLETIVKIFPNHDHQDWFDSKQFTIAFNLLDQIDTKPLLSVLQPIPDALRGYGRMQFDAPFSLQTDRQNLLTQVFDHKSTIWNLNKWKRNLNQSIQLRLIKIALSYLSGLSSEDELKKLMFDDSFGEWGSEPNFAGTDISLDSLLDNSEIQRFKNSMERIDGSVFGPDEPRYVISDDSEVGKWLNDELSDEEKSEFTNVLSFNGNFVTWNRSIAARSLEPLSIEDIVDKLNVFGKFGDFSLGFPDFPGALLPNGMKCIFLVENGVQLNEEVAAICEQFKATEICELNLFREGKESESADFLQFKNTLDVNPEARIESLTSTTSLTDILSYLETHLGGEEVCQDTFDIIFENREHSSSLVRATVSLWDGDDAFEHEMQALVSIPKNTELKKRAYPIESNPLNPSSTFLGCYLGEPLRPEQSEQGGWWDARAYPSLADEGKNIIYLASVSNHLPKKENLSLIVGSPWNKQTISQSLCRAICSESGRIIKVEVSEDENDVQKTISLWEIPLPWALEIKSLRSMNLHEYSVEKLQNSFGSPILEPLPLENNPGAVDHPSKHYYSSELKGSDFEQLVDRFVYSQDRLITSGFRLRYLRWANVFFGDGLSPDLYSLAMYSHTQDSSTNRAYVGRIGRIHAQIAGFSVAMAQFGPPRDKDLLYCLDASDGIWVLAENLVDDYNPIPGPLDNTEQLIVEQVLFKHLFMEYSWNKADFTKGIVELFINGDLEGNEFQMFARAVNGDNEIITVQGNPKLQAARRVEIAAKATDLGVDISSILDQFQNLDKDVLLENYRQLNMNLNENMLELYYREYYYAFQAYRKGIDKTTTDSRNSKLKVISETYWSEYLLRWPGSDTYDGWMPLKPYRKISDEFANRLFSEQGGFEIVDRLISSSNLGESDISLNEIPNDWILCDNPEDDDFQTWKVSLETIQRALQKACHNDKITLELYTAPRETGCKLFDSPDFIGIGSSGWDIRKRGDVYCFVTSKVEAEKSRMEHFNETMDRLEKHLKVKENPVILNYDVLKAAYDSLETNIPWYREPSWFDEHIVTDYEELQEKCLQGEISEVYQLLKTGVSALLDGEGESPPGSPGSRCMGLRMIQTEQQELEHFKPSKMRKVMDNWYERTPSMAGDEPLFQTQGLPPKTYYANVFFHHDRNELLSKKGKKSAARRMTRCNIDNFFGSRIGLSSIFFMMAKTDGRIQLNKQNGETLERFVNQHAELDQLSEELILPDALLVDGTPTALRIHPLHLAAMAAVQTALNEFEPRD